jgi:CDP-diacylglycerol--serine O-phosphatidyltransferase
LFCGFVGIGAESMGLPMLALFYGLSYLMVSSVEYLSFKSPETARPRKFQVLVTMVLFIMVIASQPEVTLFAMVFFYVLSGPFGALYRLFLKSSKEEVPRLKKSVPRQ